MFQNEEMLKLIYNKINDWIKKLEMPYKNITINFSTLSHLNKQEWIETISL